MVHPEPGDNAFIAEWVGRTKNEETGYWAVTGIRVSHGNGATPLDKSTIALLVDVMRTSTHFSTRGAAAESLGMFKPQEALPYLEECITKETEKIVRGDCRNSYWKISGMVPAVFHADDLEDIGKSLNDAEIEKTMLAFPKTYPVRAYREARRKAFEEYTQNHQ